MNNKNKHQRKRHKNSNRRDGSTRKSTPPPLTAEEFFARSKAYQETATNVAHAVTKMRNERVSAAKAAEEYNLDPRTLVRQGRSALRKLPNGRYAAEASDQLLRVITVNTEDGLREIATRDSREASIAGKHSAAVLRYLQTGDDSRLRNLPRDYITDANGNRIKLLMDLREIDRLGNAGVLSYESNYARRA